MKKIFLICILSLGYLISNAQGYPINQNLGSDSTLVTSKGGFKGRLVNITFTDTSSANLQRINFYDGAQIITTQDSVQFWLRYNNKWNKVSGGGGGGGTSTDSAVVLKNVTQIASLSNAKVNSIFVTDTIRGGNFFKYTGTDAADNGMIFSDALGQKWLRQTSREDNKINVQWYGAKAASSSNGYYDSRANFISALNYCYKHSRFNTLYIPRDSSDYSGGAYYFSDSILINHSIKLLGDGELRNPTTILRWYPHKKGLVVKNVYGDQSANVDFVNLYFYGNGVLDGVVNTAHGITISTQFSMTNVKLTYWEGDGIHLSSCATAPNGDNNNYGNADHSILNYVTADECQNGIFIEGCDANVIELNNCSLSSNRRWGVFDNGFLGNHYTQPHAAFNGNISSYENSVVTYGGLYYSALPGHDGYFLDATDSNYNKQPDLNVGTYWQVVQPMGNGGAWSATKRYYSGGAIVIRGESAWSTITAAYTEASQPPIYLNNRSKVDGGDNGAGVTGTGAWWNMYAGNQMLLNSNLYVGQRVGIGKDANTSPLEILADPNNFGIGSRVDGSASTLTFSEWTNSTGRVYFGRNTSYGMIGDNSGDLLNFTSTYFIPFTNSTIDLGGSSNRWKSIYATLGAAAGTKAVRYNPSTGLFTYADTTSSGGTAVGNFGNVQLNRFGSLATPASDSLNFSGGLAVKGTGQFTALPSAAGTKQVRIDASGNLSTQDTLTDFTISNASHYLPDSLVVPVSSNSIKIKNPKSGLYNTAATTDSSFTFNIDTSSSGLSGKYLRIVDTANIKPRIIAGTNVTITGTYPFVNISASVSGGGGGNVFKDVTTQNTFISNIDSAYTTTATAAGTTTLTNASKYTQNFTGATTQTIVLPDATTLVAGHSYYITNNSSGALTVNKNGGTLISTVAAGQTLAVTVTDISTSAGGWMYEYSGNSLTASNFVFNETPSGTINGTNATFTLANTPTAGTVRIYLNGLRQKLTTQYTISGSTITMLNIPGSGDELIVDYLK